MASTPVYDGPSGGRRLSLGHNEKDCALLLRAKEEGKQGQGQERSLERSIMGGQEVARPLGEV